MKNNLREVRSFNHEGNESGLMILSKTVMDSNADISYYMGATIDSVTEVHYRGDLRNGE